MSLIGNGGLRGCEWIGNLCHDVPATAEIMKQPSLAVGKGFRMLRLAFVQPHMRLW